MLKIIICLSAAALLLSSCGKKEIADTNQSLDAKMLLDTEKAEELLQYTPVGSYEDSYTKSIARYDSEPIGKDPIIVELYAHNDKKSAEDIYNDFKKRHEERTDAEDVTEYDAEAFLAYPSVNIYKDGYMVVVTAGSGADDAQKQLLLKAGAVAADNLCAYIKKNPK